MTVCTNGPFSIFIQKLDEKLGYCLKQKIKRNSLVLYSLTYAFLDFTYCLFAMKYILAKWGHALLRFYQEFFLHFFSHH